MVVQLSVMFKIKKDKAHAPMLRAEGGKLCISKIIAGKAIGNRVQFIFYIL